MRVGRRHEPTWRYAFNLAPTLAYKFSRTRLSSEAARVLTDLNRDGVAMTTSEALLGPDSMFGELETTVNELELSLADRIAAARRAANDSESIGQKTFIYELLGNRPKLDPHSVYARFGLQKPILQIANAYLGMYSRLSDYNVWHNFVTQVDPRESQLWHHDREDRYILKVFVCLSDIDEGAGPFTYAKGTHLKGENRLSQEPEFIVEKDGVKRSDDSQMAKAVPFERWVKGTGKKSTIIFADTRGYHKGGLTRTSERKLYFCRFTSRASESKEIFDLSGIRNFIPENKEQAFALSPRRRMFGIPDLQF
jgi:hypothetical protein